MTLKQLDRKEILRTRDLAVQQNRISADTSRNIGDILDRLGLRRNGVLTQAALVLYGTDLLQNYPQCHLKMGRFRGTEITGEIVDNRQEYLNAFAIVREGMAFLERTMPLGARFPKGQIFREDRFPVPLDALREILLNAVMHRDYSHYAGYIAIAVFDDRVEIMSYGRLPPGVTVAELTKRHLSCLRNLLIAETFHRTGAVECWGRGTNRVVSECKHHGIAPPTFEERQGFLVVTFRVPITVAPVEAPVKAPVGLHDTDRAILTGLSAESLGRRALLQTLGHAQRSGSFKRSIEKLLASGLIEYTIPDKPNSRLQKYRLTEMGRQILGKRKGGRQ